MKTLEKHHAASKVILADETALGQKKLEIAVWSNLKTTFYKMWLSEQRSFWHLPTQNSSLESEVNIYSFWILLDDLHCRWMSENSPNIPPRGSEYPIKSMAISSPVFSLWTNFSEQIINYLLAINYLIEQVTWRIKSNFPRIDVMLKTPTKD